VLEDNRSVTSSIVSELRLPQRRIETKRDTSSMNNLLLKEENGDSRALLDSAEINSIGDRKSHSSERQRTLSNNSVPSRQNGNPLDATQPVVIDSYEITV